MAYQGNLHESWLGQIAGAIFNARVENRGVCRENSKLIQQFTKWHKHTQHHPSTAHYQPPSPGPPPTSPASARATSSDGTTTRTKPTRGRSLVAQTGKSTLGRSSDGDHVTHGKGISGLLCSRFVVRSAWRLFVIFLSV
jgi:hypothetical protein